MSKLPLPLKPAHPASKPVIWIHAVSVGESLAISELVGQLRQHFPGGRILVSTTTQTGQHLARERFGADNFYPTVSTAVQAYLAEHDIGWES